MKKFSITLALLLALVMFAVPALAAQTSQATVTASDTTLDRGDTVQVTVSVTKVDGSESGGFMFSYDKEVFDFVSGEALPALSGFTSGVSTAAGNVAGFYMNGNKTVEGEIFRITLKVKDDAAYGSYTITGTCSMNAGEAVSCTVKAATVTIACNHKYDDYVKVDANSHKRTCTKCGEAEVEDHDWNDGRTEQAPTCDQPGQTVVTCLLCHASQTEDIPATGHSWDNDCDTTCNNNCGLTRQTTHDYSDTLSGNATAHGFACSICGDMKDAQAHVPGPEATNTTAQVCTVCGYEITPIITHVHQMSTEWLTNEEYHWHRCQATNPTCQHVEDKAQHDYDTPCDVDCNTCGYIRQAPPHNFSQEWQGGADGHWYYCVDCYAKSEVYPHVPGPEATETTPQRCEECNIVIKMPLNHVHDFGDAWYGDNELHWQCCMDATCFETTTMEPHTWDEGTELENGDMRFYCNTCGKEVITAGSEPPTAAPTTPAPTTPSNSQGSDGEAGFTWEWIGIAAIVLLVIGIILLVVEFIRSRKANSHGKFSK